MKKQSFRGSRVAQIVSVLLVVLLSSIAAFAQGTATVRGTVTDPQGNVVAGATVTLTNPGTNASRTATTSDNGTFIFDFIQPGGYRIEVEAQGFKKGVVTEIHALVAKATAVDIQLEIGNVAESVTVAAGAGEVLINRDDATLGNNFVNEQITQLPLEARNVAGLLTLQPGVTRSGYVAGARADQSNVTLDGVDINEQQTNQIGSVDSTDINPGASTVLRLNSEAIEEFRVITTNANAQMGRSSGAQVALVTKGGTNEYRGSLFWFHRPTILAANNFFNNRSGVARPALIRNTFGGSIGGPISKDRSFFFYSFEGRRERSEQTALQRVPLASMGRGELRYVNPSGGISTVTAANFAQIFPDLGGLNPTAVAALAEATRKYPANDFGTIGDSSRNAAGQLLLLNTAGYRFNVLLPSSLNSHTARFDHNINDKQTLFVRANVIHDLIAGVPAFPDTPRPDTWSHPWGTAIGHTWTISDRFVNNFRYGLTREAFTSFGDASKNEIYFRFVFFPVWDYRTLARTTPTHNFTDDFSWVAGNHTAQFGTNVRVVRNKRQNFASAFDTAYTNPSYYQGSGTPISTAINAFSPLGGGQTSIVRNAATALLGRLTTYVARFTFDKEGTLLPPGTATDREFATEEYDFYGQDVWKIRPNLTMTYGLRYGLSRPIYETQGFETKPNIPLSEYFRRRIEASQRGQNYNELIADVLSGPANNGSYMYPWDKNNFQPRVAIAWSPNFKGTLGTILGSGNKAVIRGGFAITNDFLGQQLATRFDVLNSVGFTQSQTSPVAFCNVGRTSTAPTTTPRLCPSFTGYTQDVRSLPRINVPSALTFPSQQPPDLSLRIQTSLDEEIISPTSYTWNVTYERELPKGLVVQASYLGRLGRNLLASRDVMSPNNIIDPRSGMDYYTAAGILEDLRRNGVSANLVQPIPFFENLFGSVPNFTTNVAGSRGIGRTATQAVYIDAFVFNGNDWATTLFDIDAALDSEGLPILFYQSQYGALSSFSTVANSEYHAGTLSVRQRLGQALSLDFNYTLSKSMDDASGLQTATSYGSAFILNPLRQRDNYSVSDFDVRHIININGLWQVPMGRGRWLLNDAHPAVDAFLGGWQLSGIFRWNSGFPISAPFDADGWATNWNVQSSGVRTRSLETCPTRGGIDAPGLFGCDRTFAYQSFRNAKPGETGDRNVFRLPGYVVLDMGLGKSFTMPWSETHKLQLRFEAFNVTNTQRMGALTGGRDGYGLVLDPHNNLPPPTWSNFQAIQGDRRVMQFGFRYEF